MAERPLLILPRPSESRIPRGPRGGANILTPTPAAQADRLRPQLNRLRAALQRGPERVLELRADPQALAPERVIVFEIAGSVEAFARALEAVPGLELLLEHDVERAADELFAERDDRRGREGQRREDKIVGGRLYLAMPDMAALNQLVGLWERWDAGQPLPHGLTAFRDVFLQIRTLRPWGPQDRISDETLAYWREEHQRHPDRAVRTEVELWFRRSVNQREQSTRAFHAAVREAGGVVVDEAVVPEIAYHGILVDIPAAQVAVLLDGQRPALALLDEVMFLRPQTVMSAPGETETDDGPPPTDVVPVPAPGVAPIVALLDGVPVQRHEHLIDRLILDDPDDLQGRAVVARRVHGTAMASLLVHGDLNVAQPPLSRPIYVRPLMIAPEALGEHTPGDRLLVDVIYRAILRIKGTPDTAGVAPTVFIVNLSIGDQRRPFANIISPLARLIDYLAARYNILFVVSAGNIPADLSIPDFDRWADFENASAEQRERAVLTALNASKHERSLLSPAESINALTVGSQHLDSVAPRPARGMAVDPFEDSELANTSCALGLGYKRAVKPELYLPAGREHLHMAADGGGIRVRVGRPQRLYGLKAAAPDAAGRLNQTAHSDGTSAATALGSRSGHQIFDALMDRDGGSTLADIPPDYYAVAVKTLLVHSARWNSKGELLKEICGPADTRRWQERAANAARFLGFGIPLISRVLDCAENQATLVGYGTIRSEEAQRYRIPLPAALEGVTDPRAVIVTVTWLSPVRSGHQSYRAVRLEAQPAQPALAIGVKRDGDQPADSAIKRGTVFHERYTGERAVPFIDDGHLSVDVWCKDDAGGIAEPVRYAIAVTIEAGTPLPIYEQIQQRLRVRAAPQA